MPSWVEATVMVLALYGVLAIVHHLRNQWLRSRLRLDQSSFSVLLIEKDQGESLEWLVRSLMSFFSSLPAGVEAELVIVDCGSGEEARAVLERLARIYPSITLCLAEHSLIIDGELSRSAELELGYFLCRYPIVVVVEALGDDPDRERLRALLGFIKQRYMEINGGMAGPEGEKRVS